MNKFVFAVLAAEVLKPPRFAMGLVVKCTPDTDSRYYSQDLISKYGAFQSEEERGIG
jgi:hypothetical protein